MPKFVGLFNLLNPGGPSTKPLYPHWPATTIDVYSFKSIFFMQWLAVSLTYKYYLMDEFKGGNWIIGG